MVHLRARHNTGAPALAGIGLLVALVPVSMGLAKLQGSLRKRHMPATGVWFCVAHGTAAQKQVFFWKGGSCGLMICSR
jgi:hypothetical protein